ALSRDQAGEARPPPAPPGGTVRAGQGAWRVSEPMEGVQTPVEEEEEIKDEAVPAEVDEPGQEEELPAEEDELPRLRGPEHVEGELEIPAGYPVLEGTPRGGRSVGVVVGRFNGELTNRLLASALEELEQAGVPREAVTILPV